MGRLRAALLLGAPTILALALLMAPAITGSETLILRDVLQVHVTLKASHVKALEAGYVPLLDPARVGGQPLAGNPNTVPFYPTNLLYLVTPFFWAFNAHFWIHLLTAPLAGYWMGRAWGLRLPASWAAGVCYGASGFMLSQLNLYNLVAGAALAPALVAAVLDAGRGRRFAAPAAGALWALLLVSGDPLTALLAAALAGTAFLVRHGPRPPLRATGWLAAAVVLGTSAALPQIVELLRILPWSLRGHQGYEEWRLAVGAFRPIHTLEWLVPLGFGRYDLMGEGGMWATELFEGNLPLFLSLYPGLLALILVAASGRPRSRRSWWAWGAVSVGVFFALGAHNPLGAWLFDLPGGHAFRYPVKLWPLVAVGAALLCGVGFERTLGPGLELGAGRRKRSLRLRPLWLGLGALALALGAVWIVLVFAPERFEAVVLAHAPEGWAPSFAVAERARWIATVVASVALLLGLAGSLVLFRSRPALGALLLLALHGVGQVYFLRSLVVTDEVAFYRARPPALSAVPPGSMVAHADYLNLMGDSPPAFSPDHRPQWVSRQLHLALYPFAGVLHGRRYELDRSPEGLGSFLGRVAAALVEGAPDDAIRLRALSRWGVDRLVSEDPLELEEGDRSLVRLVASFDGLRKPVYVFELPDAAAPYLLAETVLPVPHLSAARELFVHPDFDPERHVILPGDEDQPAPEIPPVETEPVPGRVRPVLEEPERLELEVSAPAGGVLVLQRAHLPIWRATVDGEPAEVEPANIYRMGVRVPPGEHRVRLWVDRRPLLLSGVAAGFGLLGLLVLAAVDLRRRRSRSSEP